MEMRERFSITKTGLSELGCDCRFGDDSVPSLSTFTIITAVRNVKGFFDLNILHGLHNKVYVTEHEEECFKL